MNNLQHNSDRYQVMTLNNGVWKKYPVKARGLMQANALAALLGETLNRPTQVTKI